MNQPIKLIIADDHELFRDGFKLLLKKQSDLHLIAEASDGRELVHLVEEYQPHIVITDIKMPILDGIKAAKIIKEKYPDIGIIALTMFDEELLIAEMLEAGAKGYLLKNTSKDDLIKAARTVHDGGFYFCNNTTLRLANIVTATKFSPYTATSEIKFTSRELDVIKLICKEHSNKEIASVLGISIRTVETYKENLQEKIGAKNAVGIAVYAVRHKLCDG